MWWAHERLHRTVIRDYATRLPLYRAERDALEIEFQRETKELAGRARDLAPVERAQHLAATTAACFERAARATARWTDLVEAAPVQQRPTRLFSMAWDILNRQAAFPGDGRR